MTTDTDISDATDDAARIAVLSPVLAGFTWGVLMFIDWKVQLGRPNADLGTLFAGWAYLLQGILGLGLLLIPLLIGVTTRSPETRVRAGWAGASVAALAGAYWLLGAAAAGVNGSHGFFMYSSAVVLLVPLVLAARATRRSQVSTIGRGGPGESV